MYSFFPLLSSLSVNHLETHLKMLTTGKAFPSILKFLIIRRNVLKLNIAVSTYVYACMCIDICEGIYLERKNSPFVFLSNVVFFRKINQVDHWF